MEGFHSEACCFRFRLRARGQALTNFVSHPLVHAPAKDYPCPVTGKKQPLDLTKRALAACAPPPSPRQGTDDGSLPPWTGNTSDVAVSLTLASAVDDLPLATAVDDWPQDFRCALPLLIFAFGLLFLMCVVNQICQRSVPTSSRPRHP